MRFDKLNRRAIRTTTRSRRATFLSGTQVKGAADVAYFCFDWSRGGLVCIIYPMEN